MGEAGDDRVGPLDEIVLPSDPEDQGPPIGIEFPMPTPGMLGGLMPSGPTLVELPATTAKSNGNGKSNGNAHAAKLKEAATALRDADPVPGMSGEPAAAGLVRGSSVELKSTDRYGIVVFSHLRCGFVWQRPQQF